MMKIEEKKALLKDVENAARAVGRIDDGPHTRVIGELRCFTADNTKTLHEWCLAALVGLVILEQRLTAEIEAEVEDGTR